MVVSITFKVVYNELTIYDISKIEYSDNCIMLYNDKTNELHVIHIEDIHHMEILGKEV